MTGPVFGPGPSVFLPPALRCATASRPGIALSLWSVAEVRAEVPNLLPRERAQETRTMIHPLRSRAPRLAAAALALAFASALPAVGQGYDPTKAPVTPVPPARHGQLAPAAILGDL